MTFWLKLTSNLDQINQMFRGIPMLYQLPLPSRKLCQLQIFPSTSFNISQLPNSNLSSLSKVTFFLSSTCLLLKLRIFSFLELKGRCQINTAFYIPNSDFRLRTFFVKWQKSCVVACCSLGFRRMQILTKSFCVSGLKALVPASTAFHGIFYLFLHFYIHIYGAVEQHTYLWVGPSISGITNTGMGFTAGWCWQLTYMLR